MHDASIVMGADGGTADVARSGIEGAGRLQDPWSTTIDRDSRARCQWVDDARIDDQTTRRGESSGCVGDALGLERRAGEIEQRVVRQEDEIEGARWLIARHVAEVTRDSLSYVLGLEVSEHLGRLVDAMYVNDVGVERLRRRKLLGQGQCDSAGSHPQFEDTLRTRFAEQVHDGVEIIAVAVPIVVDVGERRTIGDRVARKLMPRHSDT